MYMMFRKSGTLLLTLSLILTASCAQKTTITQPSQHVESGQPRVLVWPNRNSHSSDEATLHLLVKAGSLQENDNERGFAHFVEHMAFNGTENFPAEQLRQRMESLGLELGSHSNAYTTFDHTAYTIHLNSIDSERLEAAIELLSEWAYRIEFSEVEVSKEIPVIQNEWRQSTVKDDRVGQLIYDDYFAGSRYLHRDPIGTSDSIASATSEGLNAFYQRWYHPANMAIVVAGDVDQNEVESLVATYFDAPGRTGETPKTWPLNPEAMQEKLIVTDDYTTSGYVALDYVVESPTPQSKQDLIEQLKWQAALDIWYDRSQARLTETRGAVSDVNFYYDQVSQRLLQIDFSASLTGSDFRSALSIIEGERLRLLQSGITQDELDQWVDGLLTYEQAQQDSADYLAERMIDHLLFGWPLAGQPEWIGMLEAELPTFTPEQVRSALDSKLNDADVKVLLIHPNRQPAPGAEQIDTWLTDAASLVETQSSKPLAGDQTWAIQPQTEGEIIAERSIEPGITEWTLSNGITVLYKHSDQAPGKVYYRLVGEGGLNTMEGLDIMNARLALPTLAQSGLRDLDGPALSQWLNSQGLAQYPTFDFFDRGMAGSGPADKFPVLMRLLHVALTEAEIDPNTWEHIKQQNLAELAQLAEHPHRFWVETVQSTLHANDPTIRTMTAAEFDAVTPEGMQRIYSSYFAGAQNYRLVIVGDIKRDSVRQAILAAIATLPNSDTSERPLRQYPALSASSSEQVSGSGEQQAYAILRYDVDKAAFGLSNDLSAIYLTKWLNRELNETIRENEGSVYSISADFDGYLNAQSSYSLIIELGTDPQSIDAVIQSVSDVLTSMTDQPPEQEALETWKTTISADFEQAVNSASNQVDRIAYAPMLERGITESVVFGERPIPEGALLANLLEQFIGPKGTRAELVWLP